MPYDQVGMIHKDSHNLAFWGLSFVPPDGASRLLGQEHNTKEVSEVLFPFIYGKTPPYNEALN